MQLLQFHNLLGVTVHKAKRQEIDSLFSQVIAICSVGFVLVIMKWHKGRDVLGRVIINDRGGVDTHLGQG